MSVYSLVSGKTPWKKNKQKVNMHYSVLLWKLSIHKVLHWEKKIIFCTYNYALMLYDSYSLHKLGPKEAMCSKIRVDKILI